MVDRLCLSRLSGEHSRATSATSRGSNTTSKAAQLISELGRVEMGRNRKNKNVQMPRFNKGGPDNLMQQEQRIFIFFIIIFHIVKILFANFHKI